MYDVCMKVYSFFKLLNKKIKEYDKMTSNPFDVTTKRVTVIWVEGVNDNRDGEYN